MCVAGVGIRARARAETDVRATFARAQATPFVRMQWTVLNSAISLCGYYCAAAVVDKPWYGRRRMQVRFGAPVNGSCAYFNLPRARCC